jgi:hypothetical protein
LFFALSPVVLEVAKRLLVVLNGLHCWGVDAFERWSAACISNGAVGAEPLPEHPQQQRDLSVNIIRNPYFGLGRGCWLDPVALVP